MAELVLIIGAGALGLVPYIAYHVGWMRGREAGWKDSDEREREARVYGYRYGRRVGETDAAFAAHMASLGLVDESAE